MRHKINVTSITRAQLPATINQEKPKGGLMKCPRCQNNLVPESQQNITIDRCHSCKGIWLDNTELLQLLQQARTQPSDAAQTSFGPSIPTQTEQHPHSSNSQDTSMHAPKRAGIPTHEKESVERCPICNAHMTPVNYDYASGIIIDQCPNNHGAWLDAHELQKIQIFRMEAKQTLLNRKEELLGKINNDAVSIRKKMGSTQSSLLEKIIDAIFAIFGP
jgi:Zn-finger nucleic acid-binding protein